MELPIKVAGKPLKVNIETRGDKGPALLMVHGIPTNARLWRKVQGYLENRYRTFAMDMMGYGQSDMPLDAFEHSLSNQAEVIKEVIVGLGLKGDVILVGHDHGGGACQILASKYCDHIARLVLVDPVVFDEWPVLEVEAFNDLVGADDQTLAGAMKQAAAGFPALLRTGSYAKTAFTDKNIKENYLAFGGAVPASQASSRSSRFVPSRATKRRWPSTIPKLSARPWCAGRSMMPGCRSRLAGVSSGRSAAPCNSKSSTFRALRAGGSARNVGRLHR